MIFFEVSSVIDVIGKDDIIFSFFVNVLDTPNRGANIVNSLGVDNPFLHGRDGYLKKGPYKKPKSVPDSKANKSCSGVPSNQQQNIVSNPHKVA